MTKKRKRWPGELDKPIRELPAELLTQGGAVTTASVDDYNRRAAEAIDAAVHAERLRKLPLLAAHYKVGAQNYAGIVKKLAAEFVRGFDGDISVLRDSYEAADNKALAMALAIRFVRGFAYDPVIIAPERMTRFSDVDTEEEQSVASGAIRGKLAEGRPQDWSADRLQELLDAVTKAKKPGMTDRQTLNTLRRRAPWKKFGLEELESRLQDAKTAQKKNQNPEIERKAKHFMDILSSIRQKMPR